MTMDPNAAAMSGPNMASSVITTIWSLLAVSTIILCLRLAVKLRIMRRLYFDDLCVIFAWCFGLIHAIITTLACNAGVGQKLEIVYKSGKLPEALRLGFFSLAWGFLSPMAGRIAFCLFMLWVAGNDPKIKRWLFYVAISVQLTVNLMSVVVAYSQCGTHASLIWSFNKSQLQAQTCWKPIVQTYYGYFSGSVNTATDIFLTVMPALVIRHSRASARQSILLAMLLCLSVVAMIASIVKTYQSKALSEPMDYTYDLVPYIIWIAAELNIVMIVASIPCLRPLLSRAGILRVIHGTDKRRSPNMSHAEAHEIGLQSMRCALADTSDEHPAKRLQSRTMSWPDSISLTKSPEIKVAPASIASQEELVAKRPVLSRKARGMMKEAALTAQALEAGIVRTVEVTVSHSIAEVSVAHAALIGLEL